MHPTASPAEVDAVADKIRALGFQPHKMPGAQRIAVAITGNPGPVDPAHFQHLPGVVEAVSISKPWKLASRETHPHDTVITIKTAARRVRSSAAASSASSPGRAPSRRASRRWRRRARSRRAGATFLRGGAYKPRTSPYSFQGTKLDGPQDPRRGARRDRAAGGHRGARHAARRASSPSTPTCCRSARATRRTSRCSRRCRRSTSRSCSSAACRRRSRSSSWPPSTSSRAATTRSSCASAASAPSSR